MLYLLPTGIFRSFVIIESRSLCQEIRETYISDVVPAIFHVYRHEREWVTRRITFFSDYATFRLFAKRQRGINPHLSDLVPLPVSACRSIASWKTNCSNPVEARRPGTQLECARRISKQAHTHTLIAESCVYTRLYTSAAKNQLATVTGTVPL